MDLTPSVPIGRPDRGREPGWPALDHRPRCGPACVQNGRLDVRIEGLQIPRADGTADNPVAMIDAVVYCGGERSPTAARMPMTIPDGDARFRVSLDRARAPAHDATVLISPKHRGRRGLHRERRS